jgi:hypothetical protein
MERTRFTDPGIRAVRDARKALLRIADACAAVQDRECAVLVAGARGRLDAILVELAHVRKALLRARRAVAK